MHSLFSISGCTNMFLVFTAPILKFVPPRSIPIIIFSIVFIFLRPFYFLKYSVNIQGKIVFWGLRLCVIMQGVSS